MKFCRIAVAGIIDVGRSICVCLAQPIGNGDTNIVSWVDLVKKRSVLTAT